MYVKSEIYTTRFKKKINLCLKEIDGKKRERERERERTALLARCNAKASCIPLSRLIDIQSK